MARPQTFSRVIVVGMIVAFLLITLSLAFQLNIWADEASTLYTTQNGFFSAFQNAAAIEKQAPLYFWLIALWRDVNNSIEFARLFAIICSVVSIALFAGVASRLFERRTAILATTFFAFHPFLIWASLEIRVYSLVILLSILLVRFFYDGFFESSEGEPKTLAKIFFVVTAIVSLYTNYYLGFILAGCFAALLATKKWREAKHYFVLMLIAGVICLPLLFAIRSQFAVNTSGFQDPFSLIEAMRYLWHHFVTFILPSELFSEDNMTTADIVRLWAVRFVIVITAIFSVINRKQISARTIFLGSVAVTVFAFLFLAYAVVGSTYVELRHASVAFVPLILFLASILEDVFGQIESSFGRVAVLAATVLVLAMFSNALFSLYPTTAKRGDWARVADYIQQNETEGQPIVIFAAFDALALPYHYHGINQIYPNDRFFDFELEAKFGSPDSLKAQIDFVISEIPPGSNEIWLAVNEKCLVTDACVPLEKFVDANYTVIQEQDFYREKVRLLRKKQ